MYGFSALCCWVRCSTAQRPPLVMLCPLHPSPPLAPDPKTTPGLTPSPAPAPTPGINWGNGFITDSRLINSMSGQWYTKISDANPFFQ
jgi:hypothetical protein